jgi:hypothetical protein
MPLAVAIVVWMLGNSATSPVRNVVRNADAIEYHVRATDPLVRAWLAGGIAASATLRDVVSQLVASDIIVHVQLVDRISGGASGQLYFVTATPSVRYLRAEIVRGASRTDTIALIAHELQHAAEVAGAARVRDSVSLGTFYRGMHDNAVDANRYDSAAARHTETAVRREVISHRGEPNDRTPQLTKLQRETNPVR